MEIPLQPQSKPGFLEVLKLSWPASVTMLNTTLLKFVDGLMVSHVGPGPFSAQFLAGMAAFIPESLILGILTVINTYVSQNLGAGRYRRTAQYAWAGMAVAFGAALLILPLAFFGDSIFGLLKHEEQALETMYFRYMVISILVTLPTRVLEQFFFGIHRPRIVLYASLLTNGMNVGLNYVLIFGKLGFAPMGLEGAAIGSLISWIVQFVLLGAVYLAKPMDRKYGTRMVRAAKWRHCKDLLKTGWPAGLQMCNDMLSWSLCVAVLAGTFGQAHRAATTIAMRYLGLAFMPAVGIGIATTAIVGRYIGKGQLDLARKRTHSALLAAMGYMGLCGLLFWLFADPMVHFFNNVIPSADLSAEQARALGDDILAAGRNVMLCAALFQLFDAAAIVYVGALRGSGDTRWPMLITISTSWVVILGGGLAMVHFAPQLKSAGPWIAASVYMILIGILLGWRFESGAWKKINLLGKAHRARTTAIVDPLAGIPEVAAAEEPSDIETD